MIELAILALWSGFGILVASTMAAPGEPRFAWAPVAAILGPFWATVAIDRAIIERERSDVPLIRPVGRSASPLVGR